jgi:hypothetical protein
MIRVAVELVPGGDETRAQAIAEMTIANVSNLADISDYAVRAHEGTNAVAGTPARDTTGTVKHHDRRQTVWSLVAKAAVLAAAATRENQPRENQE